MADPKHPRKTASKFKPATAGPSGAPSASATIRKTIPSGAPPAVPTPGASKKSIPAMSPLRDVLELPDAPSAPLLTKRVSADAPHGSFSKRFKPSTPLGPAHIPPKSPIAKPSTSTRHRSPDRGETSSGVDSLNLGASHTKLPADTFKFSRRLLPSLPPRPPPPHKPSPQKSPVDFSDLNSKSLEDLRSLLSFNQMFRAMIGQMISDHIQNTQQNDIMALSLYLSQTDDRIRAVEQRITTLDIQDFEDPRRFLPAPLFVLPSASTPSNSVANRLDTRRTPPLSMAISDSSNTTIGSLAAVNPASNLTQETPMGIDSSEVVELDMQDVSAATLIGDSDDAYYDKFDPLPEDLVFFDADKHEAPSTSITTFASASSAFVPLIPAAPGGRIDHTSSPHYAEVISILKNTFKLSTFRTNQLECIVATLDGKDVFYLAPTGGGKSLCFQLPALCVTGRTQGTTFVVSPLISLITDQVAALRKKGVPAFPLTSAAEENEVRQAMRMMRSNAEEKPKLVYTTPERLQMSDSLRDVVNQLYEEKQLARFVIDEAHVIGSWGRDFRGSYAELNILRKNWPEVPIMALTGSANKDAIEDIKLNLAMRNPVCLAQSFNRPNLHYSVRKKPALKKDLVQNIAGFIKTHHPGGTGIIYVLSRAESEEMAQRLREEWGIEARHYHAGIDNEERKTNQDDWMAGKCKVIVATIAFGMGIDKPDVRFVIHATLSKDMDGYYQETGRAGRDGKSSDCVLFYAYHDAAKIENMLRNPNTSNSTRDVPSVTEIERQVSKLQGVVAYCCNESDCRRVLILRHFDEEFKPEDCHNQCDNCHRPGNVIQHDITSDAKQVIQLLQEMMAVNSRVTPSQLRDTWKGKKNRTVKPYKEVSLYASGKALSHPMVERIYSRLLAEGIISMYKVPCSSGFSNNYITLSSAAQDFLERDKRLVVAWKEGEGEEATRAPAKRAPPKAPGPAPPRKKGKEPDLGPFLELYDDIEDADDADESDALKDATDTADVSEPTTSVMSQAGTSRSAGSMDRSTEVQSKPAVAYEDEISARLKRLQDTRRLISEKFKRYPVDTILQDDTLEMLALTPPEDARAFKNILGDSEGLEQVEDKWNFFGRDFLAALKDLSRSHTFDTIKMHQDFAFNG